MLSIVRAGSTGKNLGRTSLAGMVLLLAFAAAGCHRHRARISPPAPPIPTPAPAPGPEPTPPTTRRTVPAPPTAPMAHFEEGIASWYGRPYHGRQTANGEIYDMYRISAAHRTLPFNTRVRVHDLENGREVEVRINDRGPFVEGRIIDLSYAAARVIHMPGIARVQLEILGLETDPSQLPGIFAVQVGAFKDQRNAQRLKKRIAQQYGPVTIQEFDRGDGTFYRVRVGRASTEAAARSLARDLRAANLATLTFVVRMD